MMIKMNERIKVLRKELGLTLEKFGEHIGVTKMTISRIENGKTTGTEQMFKSICLEFNVNEEWLRNGSGDIFIEKNTVNIDEFIINNNITKTEIELVKSYLLLSLEQRQSLIQSLKLIFSNAGNINL